MPPSSASASIADAMAEESADPGYVGGIAGSPARNDLETNLTAAVKAVLEQALQLSAEERAEVADALDGITPDAPVLSRQRGDRSSTVGATSSSGVRS